MAKGTSKVGNGNGNVLTLAEPKAKQGKWTRTDNVPLIKVNREQGGVVLEKARGYVTKVGNDLIYIQKTDAGWTPNYYGIIAGKVGTSLAEAKEGLSRTLDVLKKNPNEGKVAKALYKALIKNGGKISQEEREKIEKSKSGAKKSGAKKKK